MSYLKYIDLVLFFILADLWSLYMIIQLSIVLNKTIRGQSIEINPYIIKVKLDDSKWSMFYWFMVGNSSLMMIIAFSLIWPIILVIGSGKGLMYLSYKFK